MDFKIDPRGAIVETAYQSAGEAAYMEFASEVGITSSWEGAPKDAWEQAASAAILFGRQAAADAQIAYFSKGAEVPYHIETMPDGENLFTAQLASPDSGDISISVNGKYVRTVRCADTEKAIEWFSSIVKSPPGFIIC